MRNPFTGRTAKLWYQAYGIVGITFLIVKFPVVGLVVVAFGFTSAIAALIRDDLQ